MKLCEIKLNDKNSIDRIKRKLQEFDTFKQANKTNSKVSAQENLSVLILASKCFFGLVVTKKSFFRYSFFNTNNAESTLATQL